MSMHTSDKQDESGRTHRHKQPEETITKDDILHDDATYQTCSLQYNQSIMLILKSKF